MASTRWVSRYWKKNPEEVATPQNKKELKPTPRVSVEAIDDFDRGVIRRAIYGMFRSTNTSQHYQYQTNLTGRGSLLTTSIEPGPRKKKTDDMRELDSHRRQCSETKEPLVGDYKRKALFEGSGACLRVLGQNDLTTSKTEVCHLSQDKLVAKLTSRNVSYPPNATVGRLAISFNFKPSILIPFCVGDNPRDLFSIMGECEAIDDITDSWGKCDILPYDIVAQDHIPVRSRP
uniref:Uncharacterized protein n=1 Tax=Timema cristinae TaxID=61476 RepID=A0A7R9DIA7_TIMCR|nr:unnamed protein product [Timema cristinae]